MRTTPIVAACLTMALGISSAHSQTSSPGGSPSTGPASGISTNRATSISPDARATPMQRGLPANPGLSGEAGGRPDMDRNDRFNRSGARNRARLGDRANDRRFTNRMLPGESSDRFPPSRMLPDRPGSPADARRERMRPPGLEAEGSLSAAQRRNVRRSAADFSQRECEQIYDSGTGMNRQQWSQSCRRVDQRMNRLLEIGPGTQRQTTPGATNR